MLRKEAERREGIGRNLKVRPLSFNCKYFVIETGNSVQTRPSICTAYYSDKGSDTGRDITPRAWRLLDTIRAQLVGSYLYIVEQTAGTGYDCRPCDIMGYE